jgi:acyl-CoA synthetase (AMP-forming)/AMP-acid ligase II
VIFQSPLPELDVPETDFSSFVLRRARGLGAKPALIDAATGAQLTYADLTRQVDSIAGGLVRQGLQPGDIVMLCGFNSARYAVAAHAVWRAGGVVVTMNPLFTAGEMRQELSDARPRQVIASAEVRERLAEAGAEAVLSFDDLPSGAPPEQARRGPADVALILYSSGTTGLPKGALLTHRNLVASILQLYSGDLARESDVLAAIAPFFHIVGLHGVLNLGLFAGSGVVVFARYSLDAFLGTLEKHRISSVFLTPPVLHDLAKQPQVDRTDVTSLRSILCAAAPLGRDIEQLAADRLGCVVRQGYGMTEASGPVSTILIGDELNRRGSVGQLVPSTACKIVSLDSGQELGPNQAGEILVRGPQVMQGYLGQAAAPIEPGGWLHTGDVGYADGDGFLYVVDRVKEIIKYKAYQVAPAELEAILMAHPGVADAAVVPSPDPDAGEVPKAFVVRQPGARVDADELIGYVSERVAAYKKVRRLEFLDTIPKSASGKILRRLLVERERAALAR